MKRFPFQKSFLSGCKSTTEMHAFMTYLLTTTDTRSDTYDDEKATCSVLCSGHTKPQTKIKSLEIGRHPKGHGVNWRKRGPK